ncbi:MAG: hypothetical protein ACRC4L_01975 [Mycoplasma sp.]
MTDLNIKNLFIEKTNYKFEQIDNCSLFYSGFINETYLLSLKDGKKFQIKLNIKEGKNITSESDIYKIYKNNQLIYSDKNLIIRNWIEGKPLVDLKLLIELITEEIEIFHKLKPTTSLQLFPYFKYDDLISHICPYYDFYIKLLQKYKTKWILSHNDINIKNIIFYESDGINHVQLIDFEWTSYNYEWFDIINFLAEEEVYDIDILEKAIGTSGVINGINDIYNLLFVRWFFSYGWALNEKNSLPKMEDYIKKCENNLEKLFKLMH